MATRKDIEFAQTALELRCSPIPLVRIGLIGLGGRGMKTLSRYAYVDGAEITAIAELNDSKIAEAQLMLKNTDRKEAKAYIGKNGWKKICEDKEIDLVYICTEWNTHTRMAVYAMKHGKHTAVEVPAATTIKECWQLVQTSEQTRRHCFMLENCCYDSFFLSQLGLSKEGFMGETTHCEGAYLHDLRSVFGLESREAAQPENWMHDSWLSHQGNPYPTHALGPISWLLNLHRGDRMTQLRSVSSISINNRGKINTTIITTAKGKTILLKIGLTIPQPYNRLQNYFGTEGYSSKYPIPIVQTKEMEEALSGKDAIEFAQKHTFTKLSRFIEEGKRKNVPNEMNYAMDARLIYCLQKGLPLDIDVYDAAEWSCICELSEVSALHNGKAVHIPDFTRGNWDKLQILNFYE